MPPVQPSGASIEFGEDRGRAEVPWESGGGQQVQMILEWQRSGPPAGEMPTCGVICRLQSG